MLIHQALEKTLQNFSLNGKGINFLSADDLQEAQRLAEAHPDIILVVIDNEVQVNGSFQLFIDYIRKALKNKICCVTFKDTLISANSCSDDVDIKGDEDMAQFFYARERLLDITRMVMMTTEMESKIESPNPLDSYIDKGFQNKQEDADFSKEKMYNVMANDLKEPVGNIKVMLDFLTNEPELLDQKIYNDLLFRVQESANNIHEMLEDFLFWSRMFRQEIYFNPGMINIAQLARENIILLKSTAASKNITIESSIPDKTLAFADEYMTNTVIRNLIYNAIKSSGEGGKIKLHASVKNDMVEFQVVDNGKGNPTKNQTIKINPDLNLSGIDSDNEKGSGMGLVLCKEFIEKNGGEILQQQNDKSKGNTFSFTLPHWSFAELT